MKKCVKLVISKN